MMRCYKCHKCIKRLKKKNIVKSKDYFKKGQIPGGFVSPRPEDFGKTFHISAIYLCDECVKTRKTT